ncbi:hypothetical protein AJ80_01353 [Polytolypa hystricis UAMH7299]|uniref:Protein arginine N-methyltransferase n=1 Tax=Polytolypa hystricis (strain UAMH7299) TaxID=1447883 RepID=A0A2B7Z153_POLH7|nr:hypothetical protein AJ80_01353 [Polytolypa hystricis UAMH7299]
MESADELSPAFCIGQHESKRSVPVSPQVVSLAQDNNYDIVTTPITTPHFQSRVLTLLSAHLSNSQSLAYDNCGTLETSHNTSPFEIPPLTPEDTHLTPNEATGQVIGMTSTWIDLCSPDPLIADISRQVLVLEIAYAAFVGISYVMVSGPRLHHGGLHAQGLMYYARAIQEVMTLGPYISVHIWLRMVDSPDLEVTEMGDLAPFARMEYMGDSENNGSAPKLDIFGTWDAWDVIRKLCKYQSRLFVALSLPKYLPPMPVQTRWHSEPVHVLTIETSSFIKNLKGYPVLSKAHQSLISRMMRLRNPPWIILCDVGPIPGVDALQSGGNASNLADPTPAESWPKLGAASGKKTNDPTPYLSYMRNLQQRQPARTPIERFGIGYQDYLQAPLQPLTVNLESITYEVFEKDPIKYEWYERAIAKALSDWAAQKKPTSSGDGKVVLAVVGAGRGPLVTRALRASAETGVAIEVWAVEKNPNAFLLLQQHNKNIWGGCVNLVESDMRSWKGPHRPASSTAANDANSPPQFMHTPVDIFVSELLGSFGDNELSPECLDGVCHLLNTVHGISIPASYSAHLSPISAPRLHADIMNQSIANPAAPETPYVVMLHAFDFLSTLPPPPAQPHGGSTGTSTPTGGPASGTPPPAAGLDLPAPIVQTAWSFSHPNANIPEPSLSSSVISNAHNVRRTRLTFPCRERGVCHGLAGYFETVLYEGVELSTNPVTMEAKSANMISWFPIYFPLKTPLSIPDNSEITVTMFRQTDDRKVWYEWIVEVFALEKPSSTPLSSPSSPLSSPPPGTEKDPRRNASPAPAGAPAVRKVRVGMSDLHSSIKDGCLM